MRLKKLQVSGFKSFVDQTDIRLPADLVGVVGPNGCGKSNVIDAVRWVMGESSAKMLRGDNMADVIFNGSSSRKPVGKASVELIFDNSEGKAGGNYAQFAEISVQRTLTRDGQSTYSINRIKTRRKDVVDLFRGTGLGPRSYSIIEQGMVSRIVEARPDDLRVFVEEAAGTYKYKDRRRETENRIRHTRENLDRVEDIRNELDKQLRRLKRQSSSAQRYKVLKEEERLVGGQLQVLKLDNLDAQIESQSRLSAEYENQLQSRLADQRASESELESLRQQLNEAQDKHNQTQQEFFSVGGEIRNTEQRIEHLKETRQRQGEEIARLKSSQTERNQQLESDRQRLVQVQQDLNELIPDINTLETNLRDSNQSVADAESNLRDWQAEWEVFGEESQQPAQQQEVQKSRIEQLQAHLQRTKERREKLSVEATNIQATQTEMSIAEFRHKVSAHDENYREKESVFQQTESKIESFRKEIQSHRDQIAESRATLQQSKTRLQSLEEIQQATLGGDDESVNQWLGRNNLSHYPRLASKIKVRDGWERAADRILNGYLSAICVNSLDEIGTTESPDQSITLIASGRPGFEAFSDARPRLSDKVSAEGTQLNSLLADVYIADSLEQAISMQSSLRGRQCVVTQEGTLVGQNWVSYASQSQLETGVLVREEEIHRLQEQVKELTLSTESLENELVNLESRREAMESEFQRQRSELNQLRSEQTSLHNRLGRDEARFVELQQRKQAIETEQTTLNQHIETDYAEIAQAEKILKTAAELSGDFQTRRSGLMETKAEIEQRVLEAREAQSKIQKALHEKSLIKQKLDSSKDSLNESLSRLANMIEANRQRLAQIDRALNEAEDPVAELESGLGVFLEQRQKLEVLVNKGKDEISGIENEASRIEKLRTEKEEMVNQAREKLDQHKMSRQEVVVRRQTLMEQIQQQGYDVPKLRDEMPENANANEWQENLTSIEGKISRIGPVNLVAIEEFEEESERKEYLDRQHADLSEALATLESVIRKIDKETRTRFKETFDKLNAGFNDFFPQLFGGGKAELQLTSDDLLTAGVSVMARPPGKRNSTIHLLSGGEKALTAVALLFSLFRLNPAPFCMLDEVDAPLDDANVERYCRTLRTLAGMSQIIVITHNKITMEQADVLVGVTMAEAGVSRLVSVDLEQAVQMAAQ